MPAAAPAAVASAPAPAAVWGCQCLRPRAASPGDPYAEPPSTPHSRSTRGWLSPKANAPAGRRAGGADSKTIESARTTGSEISIRHFPRAHSRFMTNAARAVGLGKRSKSPRVGRGRLERLLVLGPGRALTKAKSFAAKEGADLFGWDQFVSKEVINIDPVDKSWKSSTVKVIKINITKDKHNAHQRDAVKELLEIETHFPGSIHTVELTNCYISAVPTRLAEQGDLRVLRLTDNNIAQLPKTWLEPEAEPLRSNSRGSRTSRLSGWSRRSSWSRPRTRSPSCFRGVPSARAGRASRSPSRGGRWSRSSEQALSGDGAAASGAQPPTSLAGSSGAERPRTAEDLSLATAPRTAEDLSPARSAASPSPRKSALKSKDASSPRLGRDPGRKVTLARSDGARSSPGHAGAEVRLPDAAFEGARGQSQSPVRRFVEAGERSVRSLWSRATSWLTRGDYPSPRQPQLEELRLDRNCLGWIEKGALSGSIVQDLRVLNLGHNQISFLPEDFLAGASRLGLLDLSNNKLEEFWLAENLVSSESMLEVLLLEGNMLTRLPEKLPRRLRRLGVSYNQLSELPKHIGRYKHLESIRMASNRVRVLPDSMLKLWPGYRQGGRLFELQVEENPLVQPNITAFQMGGMDAAFEQFEKWVLRKDVKMVVDKAIGQEFKMVISKTTGQTLGLSLTDGPTLEILEVSSGGLVQQWNEDHPELTVKPGHVIVEANGIRNDASQMFDECWTFDRCRRDETLELVVKRSQDLGVQWVPQTKALRIDEVTTGGLVQKWNRDNPGKAIRPGDRIVKVNSTRSDVAKMSEKCKRSRRLELVVKRESDPQEEPPVEPPEEPLLPFWAVSLESKRFPGFFLDAEETEVCASKAAPVKPDRDGGSSSSTAAPVEPNGDGGPPKRRLLLREYARGVVSLESAHSSGLFVSAFGSDEEYRDVHLAPPRPGGEAECHFRSRASEGGLVTFESLCFPGFFLNVYGSGESRKYVQLVPEEPKNPETQPWGFFQMARAPARPHEPAPPREPAAAAQGDRTPDEGERGNTADSAGVGKRMSISPIRSIVRGVQGVQSGVRSMRRMGAIASMRAAAPVNSMVVRRGRSPGSRRRE